MNKIERKLLISICMILFGFFFVNSASAQLGGNLTINDSESATIGVNISSKVMVDISPSQFAWGNVEPGAVCGYDISSGACNESNGNYYAIQIENVGSVNITHVWFNATYPTSNPFGVGSNANTDAGNYVVLTKNTSSNDYWFINRVEYNTTTALYYLRDPDGNMPPDESKYIYGRFHNGSTEYFWMINNATVCNQSGLTMYIANISHSKTQTGTTDFTSTYVTTVSLSLYTPSNDWAYGDITSGPLAGLCVAVDANCNRVFFSKWNADKPFNLCSNVNYAWDYSVDGYLVPGDSFAMKIGVKVPYGIYEGPSNSGQIYALVNTLA